MTFGVIPLPPIPADPPLAGREDGRIWLDAEELQFVVEELQTAVALIVLRRRQPDPDALLLAEKLLRSALARLPGWLLEEAP